MNWEGLFVGITEDVNVSHNLRSSLNLHFSCAWRTMMENSDSPYRGFIYGYLALIAYFYFIFVAFVNNCYQVLVTLFRFVLVDPWLMVLLN